jgi:glycosyltransferase involved in cell wall biosynthesis
VRVAFFPPAKRDQRSSFLALLADAIERAGAGYAPAGRPSLRWALTQSDAEVVHLHWLEYLATPDPRPGVGSVMTWLRLMRLVGFLAILRARRVPVVWTVHNRTPHEPVRPRTQALLAQLVYLLCDELIVHSGYAAGAIASTFRGRRGRPAHVIPHANYVGAFPAPVQTREQLREELGLPVDAFVYLGFGVIRGYKRLGLLAEQFRELPGPDLRLVVAGAANQPDEAELVRAHAAADPRIVLRTGFVPDELVGGLHLASDAAVIAYPDVFSSGALLLALSYGLPVVVPGSGTARELFGAPAVEFFDDEDLRPAMARVRVGDRTQAARDAAARFPWSVAGEATVDVYRRALAGRAGRA